MAHTENVVEEHEKMVTDILTLEKYIRRRANIKGRLTRLYNFIHNDSETSDQFLLQVKLDDLMELYNKYDDLQTEIESIDSSEDRRHHHDLERQAIEDKYFTNKAKLLKLLSVFERKTNMNPGARQDFSISGGINSQSQNLHSQPKVMLPKLQIPTFDGTIQEWTNFKALFISVIDSNMQLGNMQKLQYLKTLLRGEAAGIVSSLVLCDENYHKAMDSLSKRYENKLINVNYYIKNICNYNTISKFNLKSFLIVLQQSLDSLTSLKVPVKHWDLILIYIIVNKLDNYLRTTWEMNRNSVELPTLKELIEFLNHRSTALELISEKSTNYNCSKPNRVVSQVNIVSNNCSMCNMSHDLIKCPSFLEMDPQQRNTFVKNKRLCFNCLKPYSFHHKCSKNSCNVCHKKHHTMIHISKQEFNRPLLSTHERPVSSAQTNSNHNSVTLHPSNSLQPQQVPRDSSVSTSSALHTSIMGGLVEDLEQNDKSHKLVHLAHTNRSEVFLSTALIKVKDFKGNWHTARALLDSGSQVNIMAQDLASKLNLKLSHHTNYVIQGVSSSPIKTALSTTVTIASRFNNYINTAHCLITERISNKLPQMYVPLCNFKIPKQYDMADPLFYVPRSIDMLLGGQLFYSLLLQGNIKLGTHLPTLIKTVFGWIVTGNIEFSMLSLFHTISTVHNEAGNSRILNDNSQLHKVTSLLADNSTLNDNSQLLNSGNNSHILNDNSHSSLVLDTSQSSHSSLICSDNSQVTSTHHITCEQHIDKLLQRFWEQEDIDSLSKQLSPEEAYCETLFSNTTTRGPAGRFMVKMPLIKGKQGMLGESYNTAYKCLNMLEKRFIRNPSLHKQYTEFIEEYLALGHAELITKGKQSINQELMYFLPHHPVIKLSSVSTKLRVVFNASSQSSTGLSLNDIMYEGPNLFKDITDIIMRFRTYKFVLSCDIIKMFRNINMSEDQCLLQCILWRKSMDEQVKVLKLNTVTYGTRSAPYLAYRTLLELAKQDGHLYPQAAFCINNQTFMDDVHCGTNSLQDALELVNQLISLFKRGCFQLHKWSANHPQILQSVRNFINTEQSPGSLIIESETSTLGLKWEPVSDLFRFSIPEPQSHSLNFTKRLVLSIIAKIYDPLGYLSPVTIIAKTFMQDIWKEKLDWDQVLPSHLLSRWLSFYNSLHCLERTHVPRYCFTDVPSKVYLAGFSDASSHSFGACIYVVAEYLNIPQSSHILIGKTKVAPLKTISIPRLELCGAVLLSKLIQKVGTALETILNIDSISLFTDSSIVLHWLNNPYKKWNVFVANRLTEILLHTKVSSWSHVVSQDNPADIVTRGVSPSQLQERSLWWHGPQWLRLPHKEWPVKCTPYINCEEELSKSVFSHTTTVNYEHVILDLDYFILIFERFSNFQCLQKIIAQCYRFIWNMRHINSKLTGPLAPIELQASHDFIVKIVQESSYGQEIKSLNSNSYISTTSSLKRLAPFLDSKGILRVGGRIKQAEVQYNQKFPIILPNKGHVTYLIIKHLHNQLFHSGLNNTLSNLRLSYWPIHARVAVKKVIRDCVLCARYRSLACGQRMSNLPYHRVNLERPFLHAGVDFGGPIYVKSSSLRSAKYLKSYICLFICLASRAIHIELASDLSTGAFIACLKRFCARRGVCNTLYSDNATNFRGAHHELNKLHKMFVNETSYSSIMNYTNSLKINWKFTVPLASHMGGLYEAGIKSAKALLKKKLGNCRLTFEYLYTLLTEIESILNSRPLSAVSDSIDDLNFLSPGHFLIGSTLLDIPEPSLLDVSENKLSIYLRLTAIKQQFWKDWFNKYLSELQERQKWLNIQANLEIGNLVIVKEQLTPPGTWPLGRIVKVFQSKDDQLVRSALIKTSSGEYHRPIHKLILLPI